MPTMTIPMCNFLLCLLGSLTLIATLLLGICIGLRMATRQVERSLLKSVTRPKATRPASAQRPNSYVDAWSEALDNPPDPGQRIPTME